MSTIDYISGVVDKLVREHGTRDPFDLCKALGVRIRYKELDMEDKAYYTFEARIRSIVINNRISEIVRRFLVAHELGHDRLHKKIAMLKSYRRIDAISMTVPTEYEANLFAADLLIDDEEILNLLYYDDRTFFSIARELYVPEALIDFKLRILKHKGYEVDAPYLATGDFLRKAIVGCFEDDL